ncbi:UNVERIFIED_CONTAM: hypothetical protein Scaly_0851700 [Sesamum calycinum]|uniref:Uncharacterized protein n=1 Tax=Sesamum calycinum TaxID=2727403 RepID=A0AAW2QV61_9LAMI
MPLRPVIPCTRLPENEVIGPENLPVRARSDTIHRTGLQIHEHGAWNEPPAARFIVVDIHPLKLQIVVAIVPSGGIYAVLRAHHLPKFRSDLVAALATLDVQDFTIFSKLNVGEET